MVKVECEGCSAPYQIDEKRIPPAGLKMRCPKCGTTLTVMKPAGGAPEVDLPVAAPARPAGLKGAPPRPAAPPPRPGPPPRPAPETLPPDSLDDDLPDLPSAMRGRVDASGPRTSVGLAAAPPAPASRGGFGEIDLMVDLPAPDHFFVGEHDPDFGAQDLPAVQTGLAGGPAFGRRIPRNRTMELGETDPLLEDDAAPIYKIDDAEDYVDFPAVQPEAELPSLTRSLGVDYPSVRTAPPARRSVSRTPAPFGFGDIDLPAPPDDDAGGGFGEIDLPIATDERNLPATRDQALPFGHIDLPQISAESSLPSPAPALPSVAAYGLPSPAGGSGLPITSHAGSGLPMPAMASGFPLATPGSSLPASATASGFPSSTMGNAALPTAMPGGALPAALQAGYADHDGAGPGRRRSYRGGVGDEASLGGPRDAFDDSDRAISTTDGPNMDGALGLDDGSLPSAVGEEVDISGGPSLDRPRSVRPERPRAAPKPSRSGRARRLAILAGVVLAVGGGALALEPSVGPFGINFISDRVYAKSYAAKLDELRAAVQADFDEDTSGAAKRALAQALAAQTALPRHRPTAAFAAYVALAPALRFGHHTEDDTRGAQLLATAGEEPSDVRTLALAAQAAASGQLGPARQLLAGLRESAPNDLGAADLAGEIELAARAPADAVKAWKKAVALRGTKPSARAFFGLARAQLAVGDAASAEASARDAIAASPTHAGARNLLASLLAPTPEHEAETLTLLKAVTEDATIRGASSDAELIDAYTQIGRLHLARSRASAAEQAFAAALKIDPQAVQALIGNGELFYRSGRNSEALARFEAATRADPENILAKMGIAKTWLALERMKEAKDLLKKQREAHPNDPLVAYWLGRAEEALGNKKDAEAAYTAAIKVGDARTEAVDAYVALARLLSGAGRADDAAEKLAEASKKFPDLPALHKAKGDVALSTGRYEEARDELKAALAREDDLGTRFKLGITLRRMRAFEDAAATFDAIAAVDKDYPGLALERGLLFEETGQSDKALEAYAGALRKAPNDVDLKLRVGSTQVIAGHPTQAEPILREVVKDRPASAEANHFLGRALLMKGSSAAEAMKYLEAAVNIDGNRAEYHLYVGWAANEIGPPARAEAALKKALELDKGLADAYWQRGILRQKSGEAADALADLKTALEKRPSRYEAYATMALCYQDLLRWPEAEAAWRSAIAGNGTVAEWHYRLGKILASHGSAAASGPELDRAVALADTPGQPVPGWLYDAHLLLAEAMRGSNKAKAIESYRRFLELAPKDSPYAAEAEKALAALGATRER